MRTDEAQARVSGTRTREDDRKRPRRTYTTGRNQQINFKATPATIERF
jgi:hypothetical protein